MGLVRGRKFNIILTRFRHSSRSLKSDLFSINILDNRNSSCRAEIEYAEHYFFECLLYDVERDSFGTQGDSNMCISW